MDNVWQWPLLQGIGNELRAIITAQVAWCSPEQKQPLQLLDDLTRGNGAGDMDGQALTRIFVEYRQHPQLASSFGPCLKKVIRPDLVGVAGTTKHPSGVPKASFPGFPTRQLQSFLAPDAVDPLAVDAKTVVLQHRCDDPVAIHRLLMRIGANERDRLRLVCARVSHIART